MHRVMTGSSSLASFKSMLDYRVTYMFNKRRKNGANALQSGCSLVDFVTSRAVDVVRLFTKVLYPKLAAQEMHGDRSFWWMRN